MWYKDNIPLISPDYETRFDNGLATLTIEETFSEDTARYVCRATNSAGSAETSGHLTVRGMFLFNQCISFLFVNSFNPRFEQTTSSAHISSKTKMWMKKYLKKSCSY
jgi:hypothetical protein